MNEAGRTETGATARQPVLIIIAGPTASGKSALALALAQRLGGTVMNADAMQCYRELRTLTARPTPQDEALVSHRLYGVRAAAAPANAAWWREAALAELQAVQTPILCGGTGMYLSALLRGLADIPDPGEAARTEARALLAEIGAPALHQRLLAVDPATAAKLRPSDSQRLSRAYEVWLGTGKGLAFWQSQPTESLSGWTPRLIQLDPSRDELKEAITTRFHTMLRGNALAEVAALMALNLDPALPLLRAHGVPELSEHLRGKLTLAQAAAAAILATHQYTKRQATWFRHQKLVLSPAMHTIHARIGNETQLSESFIGNMTNFIYQQG